LKLIYIGLILEETNLEGANLERVSLIGANTYKVVGKRILTFTAGKHFAHYCDGHIKIDRTNLKVRSWLSEYRDICNDYGYSEEEIKLYGNFIKMCAKLNKEVRK